MKKSKIRILAFLFIIALIASLLSCGSNTPNNSKVASNSTNSGEFGNDIFGDDTGLGSDGEPIASDGTNTTNSDGKTTSNIVIETPTIANTNNVNLNGRIIKIAYTDWLGDKSFQTETGKYLLKRINDIQKVYNCNIQVSGIVDYNEVWASIASGSPGFDIFDGGGPHFIATYMKGKMLQPLDGLGIDFNDAKYDKLVTDALTFGGKHYGLQRLLQGQEKIGTQWVMLYNKKLLKNSGINDDLYAIQKNGNWTWDKFEEYAIKITKDTNNDGKPDIWGIADNQFQLYSALVLSNNDDWISYINGEYKFTAGNANAMQALTFYQKLSVTDKILKVTNDSETFTDIKDFRNGKIGFIVDFVNRLWTPSYYQGMSDDYGILYMPKGPKATDYVAPNPWFGYLSIPVGVKNIGEVAVVMDALLNPLISANSEGTAFKLQCESLARDQGSLDVLLSLQSKKKITKVHFVGQFLEWGLWYTELQKVLNGSLSPASAVSANEQAYNQKIKDWFTGTK